MAPRRRLSYGETGIVLTPAARARLRACEAHERTHGTAAERRAEHLDFIRDEVVPSIESPEGLRRWVEVRARLGGGRSWKNTAAIALQCPEVRWARGMKQWRAEGVSVRKGETSIRITGPGGRVLHVFDVGQTDHAEDPRYAVPEPVEDAAALARIEGEVFERFEGETVEVLALVAAIAAESQGVAAGPLPPAGAEEVAKAHKLADAFGA